MPRNSDARRDSTAPGALENPLVTTPQLLEELQHLNITHALVAKATGASERAVGSWARGEVDPPLARAERLDDLRMLVAYAMKQKRFAADPGLMRLFLIARVPIEGTDENKVDNGEDEETQVDTEVEDGSDPHRIRIGWPPPSQAQLIARGRLGLVLTHLERFLRVPIRSMAQVS